MKHNRESIQRELCRQFAGDTHVFEPDCCDEGAAILSSHLINQSHNTFFLRAAAQDVIVALRSGTMTFQSNHLPNA